VVTDIYCEFNVEVLKTTTPPATTAGRHNTIGIGTDDNLIPSSSSPCWRYWFGMTKIQGGDVGDANPVDAGRVWAGTYQKCAGMAGGALQGSKSTTERWANSIGSVAAHEAAHNYGVSHADGDVLGVFEDIWTNHLMKGQDPYKFEARAKRRHFSDHEYSVLAANVGLAMDTMWNWDFTNPNDGTTPNAVKLRMEFLSLSPSLMLSWTYTGNRSPWINPVLSGPSGTRKFKDVWYKVYQIEWSTGQAWSGGPNGQVPNKAKFHIGATFASVNQTEPDAIIITDVKLFGASGEALEQHPRWAAFDAATFNRSTGILNLRLFNVLERPLLVRDVTVRHLPRIMSINAMMADQRISDRSEHQFRPWAGGTQRALVARSIPAGEEISINVGDVRKRPYVFRRPTARQCAPPGRDLSDTEDKCQPGRVVVDLFPATTTYLTATIVDQTTGEESRLYYQIAGRRLPLDLRLAPHLK
jgi:hypothetical protein